MRTDGNLAADGQHVEILRKGSVGSSRPGMPTASRLHSGGLHCPSGLQSLIGTQLGRNVPALQIASDTPRGMCRGHLRVPGPLPHSRRLDGGRLCRGCVCRAGGGGHGAEKTTKAAGIFWALAAVVATSTCKLTSAMVVRSGTKPSQFLLDNLPFASVLLMAYAAIFEPDAVRQMTQSWEDGGLGFHGWAVFVASGVVSYFLQFSQAVAIGTTSALTHALTGQAKTASMMVLAPILYGEITSPSQFIGGAAAMACLVVYVYVNVNEMNHLTDGVKEKKDREEPAASRQA